MILLTRMTIALKLKRKCSLFNEEQLFASFQIKYVAREGTTTSNICRLFKIRHFVGLSGFLRFSPIFLGSGSS